MCWINQRLEMPNIGAICGLFSLRVHMNQIMISVLMLQLSYTRLLMVC